MTQMQERDRRADGSIYYEPVVLKVTGVSQYNPDQISFEGVPDFWQLPDDRVPPEGTIATFHLKTKPKQSPRAKPGSLYRDIVKIEKADPAAYTGPPAAPQASYVAREVSTASPQGSGPNDGLRDVNGQPTVKYWEMNDQQRRLGMAFNNLTHRLGSDGQNFFFPDGTDALELWNRWFHEASRGLPLTPATDDTEDDSIMDEVDEMDDDFRATVNQEPPAENVQELPW